MTWLHSACALVVLPSSLLLGGCDPEVETPDDSGEMGAPDEDPAEQGEPESESEPESEPEPEPPAPQPEPKPDAAVPCDVNAWGGDACTTADGEEGRSFCIIENGEELHTECSTEPPECEPGEGIDMGCVGEICYWDGEALRRYSWSEEGCDTPLVVDFGGAPLELMPAIAASFDLSHDGSCMSTDWPTAPWLAIDRDGDGFIRSGSELFGSATKMSAGGHAPHGFAALAELDSDHDGKITPADERFGELLLWSDLDEDRIGAYAELRPLRETTLVSIDLGFERRAECDRRGNCGYERTSFEYRTPQGSLAVGTVVDVHLACR